MQRKVMQDLKGDAVIGQDGPIGIVSDAYFDDRHWTIRYLVVDTVEFMLGHRVLVSPTAIEAQFPEEHAIRVPLQLAQIEKAPAFDKHAPISRVFEEAYVRHFAYPTYWQGPELWGEFTEPRAGPSLASDRKEATQPPHTTSLDVPPSDVDQLHLRSCAEIVGYRIRASDGKIGHVEDFVIDERSWAVVAIVIDTRNWLPGKKVLAPRSAINAIHWQDRKVSVGMKRDELKQSPESP